MKYLYSVTIFLIRMFTFMIFCMDDLKLYHVLDTAVNQFTFQFWQW
jgi:hypothetical protein